MLNLSFKVLFTSTLGDFFSPNFTTMQQDNILKQGVFMAKQWNVDLTSVKLYMFHLLKSKANKSESMFLETLIYLKYSELFIQCFVEAPLAAITASSLLR